MTRCSQTSPARGFAGRAELPRRIGINAVFLLPELGGLVTYVRELVPELLRAAPDVRFTIYCSPEGERYLRGDAWSDAVEFVSHPLFALRGFKAITELTVIGALAGRQVDLLHSVAMTAPLRTRAVNVVMIADVIWLHGRHPDATTLLWRALVPPVARRADRVITISDASAGEIVELLRVPTQRIDVTPLGYSPQRPTTPLGSAEIRRRFDLSQGPIILNVSTRKPHKNVLRLLEAMPMVLAARPDARLVLAGNPTAHEDELRGVADRLRLDSHVAFLPYVDPDELEGLYQAADCFVLPSVREGFGLPLLEAMGRGVPVACSNTSALPEVAGDAARYFDPTLPEEIANALIELLGDRTLRERLIALGHEREGEFSWQATAQATLESYARAWGRRVSAH